MTFSTENLRTDHRGDFHGLAKLLVTAARALDEYVRADATNQAHMDWLEQGQDGRIDAVEVIEMLTAAHTGTANPEIDEVVETLARNLLGGGAGAELHVRAIRSSAKLDNPDLPYRNPAGRMMRVIVTNQTRERARVVFAAFNESNPHPPSEDSGPSDG